MIKTQLLTPEIYYKESRDFQFFGRLYDILFNYLKTDIDLIKSFPTNNTQDAKFLELLLKTLNFRNLREYQLDQLRYLAKEWIYIIKNKGSMGAVEKAIKLILRLENIKENYNIIYNDSSFDIPTVVVQLKNAISSQESSLLEEILNYILPIGVGYVIQNVAILDQFEPMIISLEEHTSLRGVNRVDIGSLARQKNVYVEDGNSVTSGPSVGTGSFTAESNEGKVVKGSIRIGALVKKKENTEEGQ